MRLICPVCDAQYDVSDAAIPLTGRDVQCSNCDHSWFQPHPDAGSDWDFGDVPDRAADWAEDVAAADYGLPASTEPFLEPPPLPVPAIRADDSGRAARRAPDESVLSVLREEADRESALRRADAGQAADVPPDRNPPPPPLTEPEPEPEQPQVPLPVLAARAWFADGPESAEKPPIGQNSTAGSSTRRDVLKDLDEITASLRASDEPRGNTVIPAPDPVLEREKQGFRAGFLLTVLVVSLLTVSYIFAPSITAAIPAAEGVIRAYVATVDGVRYSVDSGLKAGVAWLSGIVGLNNLNGLSGAIE